MPTRAPPGEGRRTRRSYTLENRRHSLPDAVAHRSEPVTASRFFELASGRENESRSRHPERVAERNRTAVWIHTIRVVGDAELAKTRERLRRERLVQFDHVHISERKLRLREGL